MNKDDFRILLDKELQVLKRSFIDCTLNRRLQKLNERTYYKIDILKIISYKVNSFITGLFHSASLFYWNENGISQRYSISDFENIIVSVRPSKGKLKYKYIRDYPLVQKHNIRQLEVFEYNSFLIQLGNGDWYKITLNQKYLSRRTYFPYYEAYEISFLKMLNIPKNYSAKQLIEKISTIICSLCSSVNKVNDSDIDQEYWIDEFNNLIPHFNSNLNITNYNPQLALFYRGEFDLLREYENLSYHLRHSPDSLLTRSITIRIRECLINELQDFIGEFIDDSNNDMIQIAINQLKEI